MKKYAVKHHIKLLYDSVEWYSPVQFAFGKRNINYFLKEKYNTKWIDPQFSVTAISKYLENHYKSRNIKTVRIPAILDVHAISCEKHINTNKTVILYAGSPKKKDYLQEVIGGCLLLAPDEFSRIELRLAGVSKDQLILRCGISENTIQKLGRHLIIYGRLQHVKVIKLLAEADFTVLLRPADLRYAKAGFPTKVAESFASGTPVLCTITSDLDDYLTDGQNSIIVESCTAEAFAVSLKKALRLTPKQKADISISARRCAEENFDCRLYKEEIRKILSN
ncbi:MAG: glycosyltransferase [Eubacteriales bacterium]